MDPLHVQAKHQSLHHFVAKSNWSDSAVLREVRAVVEPALGLERECYWIIDDTGIPKQGNHSVGVARQYCGQLGKTENCQVAVSLSLASDKGSLPVQWRLYLPEEWAADRPRRAAAGVPDDVKFATKIEIALAQVKQAQDDGVPAGIVLADPAYGDSAGFRDKLNEMGISYAVGIRPATSVWAPGTAPLPPDPATGADAPARACAARQVTRPFRSRHWRRACPPTPTEPLPGARGPTKPCVPALRPSGFIRPTRTMSAVPCARRSGC